VPRFRKQPVDVVLDVRTRLEYWLGHLPDAIQIAVDDLERELPRRQDIRPGQRILVYCQSGARSARAAAIMHQLGYAHVTDAGGIASAREGFEA
jgi:phage shock protein E